MTTVDLKNKHGHVLATSQISEEDFERVCELPWHLRADGYASGSKGRLHNFIMGKPPRGYIWDHHNHDRLDNRRENLILATFAQNAQNKGKKPGTTSQYIGVDWSKNESKWRARCSDKQVGLYVSEVEAGKAYDKAALFLFGAQAKTNQLLTPEEMEKALQATQLNQTIKKSSYGDNIQKTKNGNFKVVIIIDKVTNIRTFKTIEEAQKYRDSLVSERDTRRMESLINTVIVRNSEGVAILPISSKKGIVGYTLVEDRHWHELSQCGLSLSHGYVQARLEGKNQRVHLYLYRKYVGKIPVGYKIDHSGKDEKDPKLKRLDNRLSNLRAVTNGQNSQNRIVTKAGTSQYQGVCKSRKKWVVAIGGKYVGSFDTEEKAALAYNVKAIEVYGEGAKLNVIIGA